MKLSRTLIVLFLFFTGVGVTAQTLPQLPPTEDKAERWKGFPWWASVAEAYAPGPDGLIRLVSRPDTADMAEFLKFDQTDSEGVLVFGWRGETLAFQSQSFGPKANATTLDTIIVSATGLTQAEFRLADELKNVYVSGDWSLESGKPVADQMRHLEEVLRAAGHKVAMRPVDGVRPVVVVGGTPQLTPAAAHRIEVYVGNRGGDEAGNTYSSRLDYFLRFLAQHLRVPMVPQSPEVQALKGDFDGKFFNSAKMEYDEAETPAGREKLQAILDLLHEQTGLDFQMAERNYTFWEIEAAP